MTGPHLAEAARREQLDGDTLPVSELFHRTVQGEGPAAGRCASFLRLMGCNLSCSWCFAPDTMVLMADWTEKAISEVQVGDLVWSYRKRRYEIARVEHTITRDAVDRVSVRYGEREVTCTPDHVFANPHHLDGRRRSKAAELEGRHLRVSKLDGWLPDDAVRTEAWWTGWLQGAVLGDGHVGMSEASPYPKVWLRVCDREFAEAFSAEVNRRGARTTVREQKRRTSTGRAVYSVAVALSRVPEVTGLPDSPDGIAGFLAGFFDAEGHAGNRHQLEMSQDDDKTLLRISGMCSALGIPNTVQPCGVHAGRVVINGLANMDRFFRLTRPILTRKTLKHRRPETQLGAVRVEQVKEATPGPVVNLSTSTGYFFANGALVEQCDSPYTWDGSRYDLRAETTHRTADDIADELTNQPGILVLTGGEPLLQQHRPAFRALLDLMAIQRRPVHVETNGTVAPAPHTLTGVELFSVSPKLDNAGPHRGHQDPTLHPAWAEVPNAHLKVVCRDAEDVTAAVALASRVGFPHQRVWVMPEGTTTDQLAARWPAIADAAAQLGVNATHRLHVLAWGDTRGH